MSQIQCPTCRTVVAQQGACQYVFIGHAGRMAVARGLVSVHCRCGTQFTPGQSVYERLRSYGLSFSAYVRKLVPSPGDDAIREIRCINPFCHNTIAHTYHERTVMAHGKVTFVVEALLAVHCDACGEDWEMHPVPAARSNQVAEVR